ncbi:MAG: DUF4445 domain-containing protein [Phycisphaerales bacterium]|nr:MAG: DUF4445 domain-containing protein [Phycisphaerales bacterium]
MKHFRVVFQPDDREVSIHQGATLLEAAGQAGIVLSTPCGGKGTCGKCLVQLPPSGQEVCACQHTVQQDLVVTVPAASRFYEHKILTDGSASAISVQPTVVEKYRAAGAAGAILGLAVDIGTTTVVAKLLDMADGRCLATEATLNPQTRYGDDVISRIHYGQSDVALSEMQRVIVDAINDLVDRLCQATGVEAESIHEACVVGNTTMNHILLGFPVTQLGQAPYRAHSVAAHDVPASELGLNMNPGGNIHAVENIAGFVGSDTTAVALAVDMDRVAGTTLAVDIGTNGELVLGVGGRLYAASCAAGPALEGARIRHGSRAAEGAIEAVVSDDGDIALDVIGRAPPRSICGSGLIDAVAVLLELGIVDPTGRFLGPEEARERCGEAAAARLLEVDGQGAFCLAVDERTGQPAVVLTQKDIREFQLAKGAIGAGIQLLLRKSGIQADQLDSLLLAGAFGNYIRPRSAVRVGLLPDVPLDRIHFVGNAAACCAEMILLSQKCRDRSAALADRMDYVEIAHEGQFSEVFAEQMLLAPQPGK